MESGYRIDGKIAVVTGGSSGIGRAISQKLAEMGALVVIADINPERAQQVADTLAVSDPFQKHEAVKLDVTVEAEVERVYQAIGKKYGRIDIAINNAGVSTMQHLEQVTEEEWDFNMDVNAKGIFLCAKHAVPFMKEHGGAMCNTASMASLVPAPLLSHYTASKYAVLGFTKTAAKELGKYHITVNCVCPGYVLTDMQNREVIWEGELRGMDAEAVRQEYIDLTPLGRLCLPEDVAKAVGFLVSPQAEFLTGVALPVAGGAGL